MKIRKKPLKMLQVFIIAVSVVEFLVTITVLGMYFAFSSLTVYFEALYLSITSVIILLIMILSIVLATKIGKKLLRPVIYIQEAAESVIHGNFDVRLPVGSSIVEINEVATDFNIMVEELGNTEMLKDEFIANVSHEFKTPLSVIEGYVSLLQGDNLTPKERDEYIKFILQNTEKLSTLTGNILAISKLENRSIPLEKEEFRLDKQICDIMVDFNGIWEAKNMDVEMDLDSISICGYRGLLARVWSNLIQNAIKFSNEKGLLSISCKEIANNIVVSIKDQGIGMDEEMRKHIFDKFYQGETSRSTEGNGLGLALVKQVVETSGGSMVVDSKLGEGSTFTVILPK